MFNKTLLKYLFCAIFFVFFICFSNESCKSPLGSDGIKSHVYRLNVGVIYTRDTSKITNPAGDDESVILSYKLHDPENPPSYLIQGFRYTEKISENVFRSYLPKVFVNSSTSKKHIVYISDAKFKLFDSNEDEIPTSSFTGENIVISGAYDLEVVVYRVGTQLHFRMQ